MREKLHSFVPFLLLALLPSVCLAQRVVTLAECQELGAQYDPEVKSARLDLKSALAQRAEARWEYVPRISLSSVGYYALRPLVRIEPQDILEGYWADVVSRMVTDAAYQAGITPWYEGFRSGWAAMALAMQPLYVGGRIANGNRLADLGVRASELQLTIKQRETAATIEQKYRLAVSLQEKMLTLDKAQEVLDSLERDASAAVEAGLVTDSDLLQVRLKKRELSSGHLQLRSGLKLAKMDLFNAIGFEYAYLEINSYVLEEDSFAELEAPNHYFSPEAENRVTEQSRLLAMQVEAGRLQKKMAVGEYLPQLAVGVGYAYYDFVGKRRTESNGLGFATLTIPITDIGKAAARARRFDSQVEKARVQQEYLDAQLVLQVLQMRMAVETAWEQLILADESLHAAQDAAGKLRVRYEAGQVTMSDLLQAELAVRQAEEERIDRKMEYNLAVNSYLRRCGKL